MLIIRTSRGNASKDRRTKIKVFKDPSDGSLFLLRSSSVLRMGKKAKQGVNAGSSGDAPLSHNPFAALAPTVSSTAESRPATKVAAKSKPVTAQPSWGKIVISREKKGRAGKTVTRIAGLPVHELKGLTKTLKKALGCGASIEGADLILLGSLTERAAAWFRNAGATKVVIGN